MIEAVIFDMDGVLIDSEPIWRQAEMEVFRKVGINLTKEMCLQTTGFRTDETVGHWYRYRPWDNISREDLGSLIEDNVCMIIDQVGVKAPGVDNIMKFLNRSGTPKALASSSSPEVIDRVLTRLDLKHEFSVIYSAGNEEFGKPHPAVYITTAKMMGVPPPNCLAIEDSLAGLIAASSARMRTLVIPEKHHLDNPKFSIANLKLQSLSEFTPEHWEFLSNLNGVYN